MEAGTLLADFYISQYRLSRVVQALLFVFESVHNKLHGGIDINVRSGCKITHFITSPSLSTLSVMFPFPLLVRLVRLMNKMVKIFLLIDLCMRVSNIRGVDRRMHCNSFSPAATQYKDFRLHVVVDFKVTSHGTHLGSLPSIASMATSMVTNPQTFQDRPTWVTHSDGSRD